MVKVIIICMGTLAVFILTIVVVVRIKEHLHRKTLELKLKPWQDSLLDKNDEELRLEYSGLLHKQMDISGNDEMLDMMVDIIHEELKHRGASRRFVMGSCNEKPWFLCFIKTKSSDCD